MRQYNPEIDGLFFQFDPYLAPYDKNDRTPLFLMNAKEAFRPGTPAEIIAIFEKWKPLAKKRHEEAAKFNFAFS